MKIYFLSSMPAALTVNGAYLGIVDGFERFAELALRDNLFIRFEPENALPIGFFLTEQIRFSPPENCEVYFLKDGIAIYARDFPPNDFTLKPIAQKREGDCLATVFRQGEVQLALQTQNGAFNAPLPRAFTDCELSFHEGLIFVHNENSLAIFTQNGDCVFLENVLSYRVENQTLTAVLPLLDSLGRKAECTYTLSETGVERLSFTLMQERSISGNPREELLAYAFFESVLLGADCACFLSDELLKKAEEIKAFLGNFIAVTVTESPFVCGLVRKKAERLFEVAYYTVEISEGKITDIQG